MNPSTKRGRMAWAKASGQLIAMLETKASRLTVEKRKMFGSTCWFANGNMFAGVHEESVILRMSEADRKEIIAAHDEVGLFEPMPGRKMREYLAIPSTLANDEKRFDGWLKRSHRFAASLLPKEKKPWKKKNV